MRSCPGCQYLVPAGWETCKRCGAALGAAAPVPSTPFVAVPPPPRSFSAGVGTLATPLITSTAPTTFNTPSSSSTFSSSSTSSKRTFRNAVVGAVLAAALVVAAGVTLRSIHTEHVSPAIASYVEGRTGVVYIAPNHSFSATFPVTPIEVSQHITAYGHDITMRIASANAEEKYSVVVAAMDLPPGVLPSTGSSGVPRNVATESADALSAGGKIVRIQRAMQDGHTAQDIELRLTHGVRAKFRVVMVSDRRVVVVGVVSPYRDAPGFQRLIDSLHVEA